MALPYVTREELKKNGGGGGGGGGGASTAMLAPAWEPNHAYIIGDVVSYRTGLYECIDDHTSDSSWSSEYAEQHWTTTTVFDSITGLLNTEL